MHNAAIAEYLNWVILRGDAMPGRGQYRDVHQKVAHQYVNLDVRKVGDGSGWPELARRLDLDSEDVDAYQGTDTERQLLREVVNRAPESLENILKWEPTGKWLLLGEAGAGKTTVLQHVAVVKAKRAVARMTANQDVELGSIPVLTAASAVVEHGFAAEKAALSAFCSWAGRQVTAVNEALRSAIDAGHVVFLLDGLDELAPPERAICIKRLQKLSPAWYKCGIVVASRKSSIRGISADYCELELCALSSGAQRHLLTRLGGLRVEQIDSVLEAINGYPAGLIEFGRRPFTLMLLGVLERDFPRSAVPTAPIDVFGEVVEGLITGPETWSQSGRVPRKRRLKLTASELYAAMSQLAFALTGEPAREWAAPRLSELALQTRGFSGVFAAGDDVCQALADDTGELLTPTDWRKERWRFIHNSLLSFLAAKALASEPECAVALATEIGRCDDSLDLDRWLEPVTFLAEMGGAPMLLDSIRARNVQFYQRILCEIEAPRLDELLYFFPGGRGGERIVVAKAVRWAADRESLVSWLEGLFEATAEDGTEEDLILCIAAALVAVDGTAGSRSLLTKVRARVGGATPLPWELGLPTWVSIQAGHAQLGSPAGVGFAPESPAHRVQLTRSFRMLSTPVTQALYLVVMGDNPSTIQDDLRRPVEHVSWDDARRFCRALSKLRGEDARLPTEAEWEYACRAGTQTAFSSGDSESDVARVAWYHGNSLNAPHPVAMKEPNRWGLYDMHGNVWEWCNDSMRVYSECDVRDPHSVHQTDDDTRVVRGGSWNDESLACRSAARKACSADFIAPTIGFRVVLPGILGGGRGDR